MFRATRLAAAALFLASPLLCQSAQPSASSIEGAWKVNERIVTGANASTNSTPQPSLYIFTKQHYSIVALAGTTTRPETPASKDPANPTDAEKIALYTHWLPLTANSGTYTFEGTTLTTRPLVAKGQSVMTGPVAVREAKIEGNTLWLVTRSAAGQPASETRLRLTRVE